MFALRMPLAAVLFAVVADSLPASEGLHGSPDAPLWKGIADDVYLQEVGAKIPTESSVTAVAFAGGTLFALRGAILYRLEADQLSRVAGAPDGVWNSERSMDEGGVAEREDIIARSMARARKRPPPIQDARVSSVAA